MSDEFRDSFEQRRVKSQTYTEQLRRRRNNVAQHGQFLIHSEQHCLFLRNSSTVFFLKKKKKNTVKTRRELSGRRKKVTQGRLTAAPFDSEQEKAHGATSRYTFLFFCCPPTRRADCLTCVCVCVCVCVSCFSFFFYVTKTEKKRRYLSSAPF